MRGPPNEMRALTVLDDGRAREVDQIGWLVSPTDSTATDRQAIRLSRRFALPMPTARAVAELAFAVGASR